MLIVDSMSKTFRFPEIKIQFNVSPDGRCQLNPPEFPCPILLSRKMGRSGHVYQRYVKPHELLSSTEAAMILKVSLTALYYWVDDGILKPKRVKDRLFFVSRDVQKLARKRGIHPVPGNPEREKKFREARRKGLLFTEDENGVPWLVG